MLPPAVTVLSVMFVTAAVVIGGPMMPVYMRPLNAPQADRRPSAENATPLQNSSELPEGCNSNHVPGAERKFAQKYMRPVAVHARTLLPSAFMATAFQKLLLPVGTRGPGDSRIRGSVQAAGIRGRHQLRTVARTGNGAPALVGSAGRLPLGPRPSDAGGGHAGIVIGARVQTPAIHAHDHLAAVRGYRQGTPVHIEIACRLQLGPRGPGGIGRGGVSCVVQPPATDTREHLRAIGGHCHAPPILGGIGPCRPQLGPIGAAVSAVPEAPRIGRHQQLQAVRGHRHGLPVEVGGASRRPLPPEPG